MNKIILIGNLTHNPESSTTSGGVSLTRFSIAVNRPYADAAGNRVADYFNIITYRNLAKKCAEALFIGCKVGINGSVHRRQYEDRNGISRTSFDVIADEVEFLTPKSQRGYNPDSEHVPQDDMQPVENDDLQF